MSSSVVSMAKCSSDRLCHGQCLDWGPNQRGGHLPSIAKQEPNIPGLGGGATPNKNPATALVRAGDFLSKPSGMKNDPDSRLKDGFGSCLTQNMGKNNGK